MPQSHNLVATKTVSGEVQVFDIFKQTTRPVDKIVRPTLRLTGHLSEGYGLSWNSTREGLLLSGSDDGIICIWDINSLSKEDSNVIEPINRIENSHDGKEIEDVCWNCFNDVLFASVGDDKRIILWDRRQEETSLVVDDAHTEEVMCVDQSPFDEYLLLTGSTDNIVKIWDLRNMSKALFQLRGHKDHITQAKFSPLQANLVASSSADRKVNVWDLAKINTQSSEGEDGDQLQQPAELLFVHGGHCDKVSDIAWNLNEKLTLASVSQDNVLQVWKIAEEIYTD